MEHGNGGSASHPLLLKTQGVTVWPQKSIRIRFRCVLREAPLLASRFFVTGYFWHENTCVERLAALARGLGTGIRFLPCPPLLPIQTHSISQLP